MFEVKELCGQLCLGKQGENLARIVYFEEPALWKEIFGEGECLLVHQRNGDEAPYPVETSEENGKCCWKITNADTEFVGEGKCELFYYVDGVIVKSKIWTTSVLPSLGDNLVEPPEPQQGWVDQVLTAAVKVEKATTHQPIIGENKNWFVWDAEAEGYVDTGVSAIGEGDSVYDPKSNNAQSGVGIEAAIAGRKTADGGEIFNDYQFNKAGKFASARGKFSEAADYASSEGYNGKAIGNCSHVENKGCIAEGECSHAGGLGSKATKPRAFAHGWACEANHNNTVALGGKVIMNHDSATGMGYYLTSSRKFQANFGQFNAPNSSALFVVGNGKSEDARSNAFVVLADGRATITAHPKNDFDVATKKYVDSQKANVDLTGYTKDDTAVDTIKYTNTQLGENKSLKDYLDMIVDHEAGIAWLTDDYISYTSDVNFYASNDGWYTTDGVPNTSSVISYVQDEIAKLKAELTASK